MASGLSLQRPIRCQLCAQHAQAPLVLSAPSISVSTHLLPACCVRVCVYQCGCLACWQAGAMHAAHLALRNKLIHAHMDLQKLIALQKLLDSHRLVGGALSCHASYWHCCWPLRNLGRKAAGPLPVGVGCVADLPPWLASESGTSCPSWDSLHRGWGRVGSLVSLSLFHPPS